MLCGLVLLLWFYVSLMNGVICRLFIFYEFIRC